MSCIVGNGVARPTGGVTGGVTGGFSLSSLVEYGEDEDDDEDSLKNGTRDGRTPEALPSMHLVLGMCEGRGAHDRLLRSRQFWLYAVLWRAFSDMFSNTALLLTRAQQI